MTFIHSYTCTEAILDHMAASGPHDLGGLRRYCREQAVPYDPHIFTAAMKALEDTGAIVEVESGGYTYFDFPEKYYTK